MNNPMMTLARLCGGAKMMTIVEMRIAYIYNFYVWGSVGRVGPPTVWLGGLLFSLLLSTSLLKCAFTLWCTVWALCKSGGGGVQDTGMSRICFPNTSQQWHLPDNQCWVPGTTQTKTQLDWNGEIQNKSRLYPKWTWKTWQPTVSMA